MCNHGNGIRSISGMTGIWWFILSSQGPYGRHLLAPAPPTIAPVGDSQHMTSTCYDSLKSSPFCFHRSGQACMRFPRPRWPHVTFNDITKRCALVKCTNPKWNVPAALRRWSHVVFMWAWAEKMYVNEKRTGIHSSLLWEWMNELNESVHGCPLKAGGTIQFLPCIPSPDPLFCYLLATLSVICSPLRLNFIDWS